MKALERQCNENSKLEHGAEHTKPKIGSKAVFQAARDARGRKVKGLQIRNGRFYASIWAVDETGKQASKKFALKDEEGNPVQTLTAAREAQARLLVARQDGKLPQTRIKPTLGEYIPLYMESPRRMKKKPRTQERDEQNLNRWLAFLGADIRIDRITPAHIESFQTARLKSGVTARTINLDLGSLRGMFKHSIKNRILREMPHMENLDEEEPKKRPLITPQQFEALLSAAVTVAGRNGEQLRDYLRFLAFTGCREQEALGIRWQDVDTEAGRMSIGAAVATKNGESRMLDINPDLLALLSEMKARRAPDSEWLFPSPRRGENDRPAKTFRVGMKLARKAAGIPWFGFHDLRHRFVSYCVMSGIDFLTIARWAGHRDGGVLIGKVYGHLADEHRTAAAAKVRFELAALPDPKITAA